MLKGLFDPLSWVVAKSPLPCVYCTNACVYCFLRTILCFSVKCVSVRRMIHKLSCELAAYCVSKSWVETSKLNWCTYAIEKRLGTVIFVFLVFIFSIITKTCLKTFSFTLTLYFFRSRMGGWHAKHSWSCQIISVGTVVLTVLLLGPMLERLKLTYMLVVDILVILGLFFVKPVYPAQAHFAKSDADANIKRKNRMLIALLLIQGISLCAVDSAVIVYSSLALMFTALAVLLEYIYNGRGCTNHESD